MNRDPLLGWAMPFQLAGFYAASRDHYLRSASFAGAAATCRLPGSVVQAAAASICLAALKISRKRLPVAAAFFLKSP